MRNIISHLVSTALKSRKIAKLVYGPFHVERAFFAASKQYQWFRKGDNRFTACGMHGHSGALFFESFDEGLKEMPKDRFEAAFLKDAAAHTRRRFQAPLRSKPIRAGGRS